METDTVTFLRVFSNHRCNRIRTLCVLPRSLFSLAEHQSAKKKKKITPSSKLERG